MGFGLGSRLSFMMFLQYAIWGAWLPLLLSYMLDVLKFSPGQIGYIFMAGGVGAIFGPFIAGQVADRWFSTEKYLGIVHIIGGLLIWQLSWISEYWMFFGFSILYSLLYSPTLALTNSLAFHHIPDRDRDFGWVRCWGTIGWIVVGVGIGQWLLHMHTPVEGDIELAQSMGIKDAFRLSAVLGVIMGVYCFSLPKTPPQKGKAEFAVAEAAKECSRQPLLMLFLIAVPISMIHQFYFVYTADFLSEIQRESAQAKSTTAEINKVFGVGGGGIMTIGQMSEFFVIFLIPFFAAKVSRKFLLAVGIFAYALRMFLFSQMSWIQETLGIPDIVIIIAGVSLHGVCFGSFIFVAFLVVDEETSVDIKASAQNLFNLVIVGIGIVVGSIVAGHVGDWAMVPAMADGVQVVKDGEPQTKIDYAFLYGVPMYAALGCLAILLAFYPRSTRHVAG